MATPPTIDSITLTSGAHDSPAEGLCVIPSDFTITSGSHQSFAEGGCAMEWVAMLAREPHSDRPQCACPVLGAFARRINDLTWPTDADRTDAMRPAVLALLNSRSIPDVERARRAYLVDCSLRWYAPLAIMSAVVACEGQGLDCATLRSASLRLCEEPSRHHAIMAYNEALKARSASYTAVSVAAESAYAAAAAGAAAAAYDAAYAAAYAASESAYATTYAASYAAEAAAKAAFDATAAAAAAASAASTAA